VAIAQQVDRGVLSYTSTLAECLDVEFQQFDPEITVHQLLTHTSGISSYFEEDIDDDYEALWREVPLYQVLSPADFLPLFQNKPMKFPPGARFDYNDGGYILLGLILEQAAGEPFIQYVEREIFRRAGMMESGYFSADQLPRDTALSYIDEEDGSYRTNIFSVPIVGGSDGGAYISAADMTRFWRALRQGELLSEQSNHALFRAHVRTSEADEHGHYGHGVWLRDRQDGLGEAFVQGWDPGVAMISGVVTPGEMVITVLSNTNAPVWKVYQSLLEQICK
jgi:CubicO group peptidase (beta-lactamase class C family)